MATAVSPSTPTTLLDLALACQADPLQYVCCAYSWDEGLLDGETGPDTWQVELLEAIREALLDPGHSGAIRLGVASGHGIGKGALAAWLIQWYMSCRPNPQIVVTANTASQLLTKTWRELAKWHQLNCFRPWFEWTKTGYFKVGAEESWFAAAIPWNESKPEAFQGAHDRFVMVLEDEASSIPDIIHDTIEGSMTTPQAIWLKCGNPTRNTGRFKEIFPPGRLAHRWRTWQIDSRDCKKTDKAQIAQWVQDYGEDSDFVRVRVRGLFPRVGSTQFIGEHLIQQALERAPWEDTTAAIVVGVDVARYGDDRSVILVRKGPQLLETRVYREKDTIQVAGYVTEVIEQYKPQAVFIDCDGLGVGVFDQVKHLGYRGLFEIHSGGTARDSQQCYNKRAEMWAHCKGWLESRAQFTTKDLELGLELTQIEYGYDIKGRLQMERKQDLKARGLASPDLADALCLTFAEYVAPVVAPVVQARQPVVGFGHHGQAWMG